MRHNIVVNIINQVLGSCVLDSVSGTVIGAGSGSCGLQQSYGSVYGIAVRLQPSEVAAFWSQYNLNCKMMRCHSDWKTIGENYYPLYWGRDSRLGTRIYAHLSGYDGTGAVNLSNHTELFGKEVVFGICICSDYTESENILHKRYPDLYTKTN